MEQVINSFVHFPIFLATWFTFFGAAIISFFAVMISNRKNVSPSAFLRHCFPFNSWSTKSARIDVMVYLAGKLTDKTFAWFLPLCTVFVSAVVSGTFSSIYPDHIVIRPNYFIVVCCSLALFLVVEFSNYLTHYMQHYVPILWEIHKVHHSATFLNPLTAKRGHPLGFVFDGVAGGILAGIPAGLFGVLFGFSLPDIFLLYACANKVGTIVTLDALKHSHFPISFGWFDRLLISPHMHQIHHSSKLEHWDKNFGVNLSVWDWMFGTAYKPAKDEEIVYGLGKAEEEDYDRLLGVYVGPIVKMWNLVKQRSTDFFAEPSSRSFGEGIFWRKPGELQTDRFMRQNHRHVSQ